MRLIETDPSHDKCRFCQHQRRNHVIEGKKCRYCPCKGFKEPEKK